MRLDVDEGDEEPTLNLTPMLDVVFNLLLFFLAATTFAKEEVELDLRLPQAASGQKAQVEAKEIVVNLMADGRMQVDGRAVTLEALRQKLEAAQKRDAKQSVLVRGDRAAQFGLGIQVLDACRLAKIGKVEFAALPEPKR